MGTFCRTVTFPCHLPPVSFIERKNKQLINKSQKTNEKKERFRVQNLSKISNRKPVSLVLLSHVTLRYRQETETDLCVLPCCLQIINNN